MRDSTVSRTLSIPSFINYTALSDPVEEAFSATGDQCVYRSQSNLSLSYGIC
jgi:hypothetical protein